MTENKMTDVIWLGWNIGWNCAEHKIDGCGTEYLRAEPVKGLLKQARRVIFESQTRFANNDIAEPWGVEETITAIDKFLDGK